MDNIDNTLDVFRKKPLRVLNIYTQMVSIQVDRCVYLDLNITQCIHVSKHPTVPHGNTRFSGISFSKETLQRILQITVI